MKRLILVFALLVSLSTWAVAGSSNAINDAAIAHYIHTRTQLLEVQIDQLHSAINLLSTETLSDQAKFERIGQPSFAALDAVRKDNGYSTKNYHQFYADYKVDIERWLVDHPAQSNNIVYLELERDQLLDALDGVKQ